MFHAGSQSIREKSYLNKESGGGDPLPVLAEGHVQVVLAPWVGQVDVLEGARKVLLSVYLELHVAIVLVPPHIVQEVPQPRLSHFAVHVGGVFQLLHHHLDPAHVNKTKVSTIVRLFLHLHIIAYLNKLIAAVSDKIPPRPALCTGVHRIPPPLNVHVRAPVRALGLRNVLNAPRGKEREECV